VDDPVAYRRENLERWEASAPGWAARRDFLMRTAMPVSRWMIDAIAPQPGQTVLELAAGPGETGFLAAELVRPGGTLICSDLADAMLGVARARAAELGLDHVEFRALDVEAIDLPVASVDAVLCRWGLMFAADPAAAMREIRRVLRPGGRLALAAWDDVHANPWVDVLAAELDRRGIQPRAAAREPGGFAFAPPGRLRGLLEDAGFAELVVEPLVLAFAYPDADAWWAVTRDLNAPLAAALDRLGDAERAGLRASVEAGLAPYRAADGSLTLPARALVAAATA